MKSKCHKIFSCYILAKSFKFNNKINLVNRFSLLFLLFLLNFNDFVSQAILPTSRTSWDHSSHPTGWTHTATSRRTTTSACTGSDGVIFDNSNDRIVIQFDTDPDVLTFKLKKQSMSGESFVLVENSIDGSSWTTIGTYGTATGASVITDCGDISISLICGIRFVRWTYTKATGNCDMDDVSITKKAAGECSSNTITTGVVTGAPFDITCTTGDVGSVAFTSTGVFTAGNIYTAQLSDAAGAFGSPLDIGTLSSNSNSGNINISIPGGLSASANYRIRAISSTPFVVGSLSSTFTINLSGGPCTPKKPFITSVILNGCDGACTEGRTEIVFANTGGVSINTNNANNINLNYTTNGAQNLLLYFKDGSAITTALNTAAGCAGTFVDGRNTTIPPNSKMMFVSEAFCPASYDTWNSYCGTGPIYVLYGQDGASSTTDGWVTGGNFGNSSGPNFDLVVTATNGETYRTRYNYSTTDSGQGDGNYVIYASNYAFQETEYPLETTYRAPISNGVLTGCEIIPLPVTWGEINAVYKNEILHVNWTTLSERNNDYFEVLLADEEALDFQTIGMVKGFGTTSMEQSYSFQYPNLAKGQYYIKLKQVDFNGKANFSQIKSVTNYSVELEIIKINSNNELVFSKDIKRGSKVIFYDLTGKELFSTITSENTNKIETPNTKGLVILKIENQYQGVDIFKLFLD
jgi:hypothetical protein